MGDSGFHLGHSDFPEAPETKGLGFYPHASEQGKTSHPSIAGPFLFLLSLSLDSAPPVSLTTKYIMTMSLLGRDY